MAGMDGVLRVMGELNWVYTAMSLLAGSLIFYGIRLFNPQKAIHEFGWISMLLSMICLIISLIIRSQIAEYFALSNMYESMLVVCICLQGAFLCFDRWFDLRALGFPSALLLVIAIAYDLTLPTDIRPLQPALQSYWRSIHVPIILLSYALLTLSFLSSLVYIVKYYILEKGIQNQAFDSAKSAVKDISPNAPQLAMAGATASSQSSGALQIDGIQFESDKKETSNIYDEITYRCVAFAFPLLAIGIILGGMWANEAWGNYWSWDPKESMSLVLLLAYGVYLHMRVNQVHPPRTLAWISVIGFIVLLITYYGVNLMGVGLHSYGKIG